MPINNIQNYETEDHFDVVTGLNGKQQLKPKAPVVTRQADGGFIATNPDGSTVGPWYTDTVVAYTFPATVPESGVMSVAGSDGSTQTVTITHPDDNDIASHTITNGVVHYYDEDGVEVAGRALDLNGFISSDHPTIKEVGDATATFDAAANEWSIGFTDTNTTYVLSQNAAGDTVLTDSDGGVQVIPDTDLVYNKVTSEDTGCDSATKLKSVLTPTDLVLTDESIDFADGRLTIAGRQFGLSADRYAVGIAGNVNITAADVGTTVWQDSVSVVNNGCANMFNFTIQIQFQLSPSSEAIGSQAFIVEYNINGGTAWNNAANGSWDVALSRAGSEAQFIFPADYKLPACSTTEIGFRLRTSDTTTLGPNEIIILNQSKFLGTLHKLCEV